MKTTHQSYSILTIIGFALLIFGVRLAVIDTHSSWVPFYDDWGMGGLLQEYESGELDLAYLFKSNNGHIGVWREMLQIFIFDINQSQWDPQLQMVVNAAIWTITGVFLITLCLRFFDAPQRWVVIGFILLTWLFPTSIDNVIWGVQGHSYNMVLFTVLAFWLCTASAFTKSWYWGLFFVLIVPLTMGGGTLVAPAILAVNVTRFLFDASARASLKPSLAAMGLLSVYCVILVKNLGSSSDPLVAESFQSFLTTCLKALSYPLHTEIWPSLFLLIPLIVLGVRILQGGGWHNRLVIFTLTIFAYTVALAITIGYARGLNGLTPASRYFEFLQLYSLASLIALVLLREQRYALNKFAYAAIVLSWSAAMILGGQKQYQYYSQTLSRFSLEQPEQERLVRDYLLNGDQNAIKQADKSQIPYPSVGGMIKFLNKVGQEDIYSAKLQVPESLIFEPVSTAFTNNGTWRDGGAYQYRGEAVVGSFDPDKGGNQADGTYVSQIFARKRDKLMIPITGYLGYPHMYLQLLDLDTNEKIDIKPRHIGRRHAEQWQEIIVDSPPKAFRIIATDDNPDYWFGFAAPRTMGKVSYQAHRLLNGHLYVIFAGIILLIVGLRTKRSLLH